MKKAISKRLSIVITVTMLFVLALNLFLQIETSQKTMEHDALQMIDRIEGILKSNEEGILHLTESLKEGYLVRAGTLAHMLVNHPELDSSSEELLKLAQLLQVDEISLFDTEGTLYSGSHPEFYGYTMYDGEQISYFLPMLEDKTLSLCQDVMPNTILGRPMVYAAVWREDGKGIVQIGIDPKRILDVVEKNDVEYIFSNLAVENGIVGLAVDTESGIVRGSTDAAFVGRSAEDLGLNVIEGYSDSYVVRIDGKLYRCLFRECGDMTVGMAYATDVLYRDLLQSMLLVLLYLILAAAIMIFAILKSIDFLVIDNIRGINNNLQEITNGNLDTRVEVNTLPEFVDLSNHINLMTDSLLSTSMKISRILDVADAQIGFFEYSDEKKHVFVTRKVATILAISPDEMSTLCTDRELFANKIQTLCAKPIERSKNIYALPTETACYVKLETYEDEKGCFGVVTDVTEEILEKVRLRHERDHDLLTQLNMRRPFYRKLGELFADPGEVKQAVMLMFDLDGLKGINDTCGHAGGDKAIREAANLLSGIDMPNKLVARLSGDEFSVFLYGADSREELQRHIDELYSRMQNAQVEVFDTVIPVRLSGGYVFYPEHKVDYTDLLRMADQALYHSKRNGKARFSEYNAALEQTLK